MLANLAIQLFTVEKSYLEKAWNRQVQQKQLELHN